jgi:hypothetical protein
MQIEFLKGHLWWLALLLAGLVFLLVRLAYGRTSLAEREKRFLSGLRLLSAALLLLAFLQPVVSSLVRKMTKPELAVLLDRSYSMSVKGGDRPVFEDALSALAGLKAALAGDFDIRSFAFSGSLAGADDPSLLKPDGEDTDLNRSLKSFLFNISGREYRGIVLLSDGRFDVNSETVSLLKDLRLNGIRFVPLLLSDAASARDIAVRFGEDNPEELYSDQKETFRVEVSLRNPGTSPVRLKFYDNGAVVAVRDVPQSRQFATVAFDVTASREGVHDLKVEAAAEPADGFPENDSDHLFVRVNKGKFDVGFLYGSPSWEFKFLRQTLDEDPTLKLTASVLSLDPKAAERLKLQDLDLLIVGNASMRALPDAFLSETARRVRTSGLSLLLLGGDDSFFSETVRNAAFNAVLPFETDPKLPALTGPVSVALTPEGESSPVMLLADDPAMNRKVWAGLPPLSFVNRIVPKKGSSVLATASKNDRVPLMGSGVSGIGKVFYVAGYPTWRWAFLNLAVNDDNLKYRSFVKQLVRDLTSFKLDKVNLYTDRFAYPRNSTAKLYAVVLEGAPAPGAGLAAQVSRNGTAWKTVILRNPGLTRERFEADLDLEEYGDYRAVVTVNGIRKEAFFVVQKSRKEYFATGVDRAALERLAGLAGTKLAPPGDLRSLGAEFDATRIRKEYTVRKDLWDSFFMLLAVVLLLSAEWIIRKRRGLL